MGVEGCLRWRVEFRGHVQGVGFRMNVVSEAGGHAVTGWVRNVADGSVEMLAEGTAGELRAFLAGILERMDGFVRRHTVDETTGTGEFTGFEIRA